ncbi:hypothetical protein [Pedobacter deserti]
MNKRPGYIFALACLAAVLLIGFRVPTYKIGRLKYSGGATGMQIVPLYPT